MLAAFTQLTDIHVVDVQSPCRFEFFDAYGSLPIPGLSDFQSAYRPQELLSAQVAESMVQQVRNVRRGPATGRRLQFAIATGDNTDNCQFNELRWYVDVLDGRHIRPDSGDLTRFEGVMDDVAPDPYYWHPTSGAGAPSAAYGFPTVPGLLDAARRPFDATGRRDALVLGVRQPRRAGAGQRPALARCSASSPSARSSSPRCRRRSWPRR